jgi:hypothetical protein
MARHRLRPTAGQVAARTALGLAVVVGAPALIWLGAQPSQSVSVPGNFTTQAQPLDLPRLPTEPAPTTDPVAAFHKAEPTPIRTRERSASRVKSAKRRGAPRESAPTTTTPSSTPTTTLATTPTTTPTTTTSAPPVKAAPPSSSASHASSCPTGGIEGGAVDWVERAAHHIAEQTGFDGPMLGTAGRAGNASSDHPSGHAIDFMTRDGDRLADWVLDHRDELGVTYVIWRQRYNDGSGWDEMADRGGDTANHRDHVHVSFGRDEPDVATFVC